MSFREETDTMGKIRLPADAYYGAQTQRAVENFSISGLLLPLPFVRALALIKKSAAQVNVALGELDTEIAAAVVQAAGDVMTGELDDHFVVDVFQTGSGTSTNMNMNEVIAGRANELLTGTRGGKAPVHPNDHVNKGQSSNDAIPTALHVAALGELTTGLLPALAQLEHALAAKAEAFKHIRKIGRTHLQDAVPMTLGQVFSGFARQIELGQQRIRAVEPRLAELALGGTAVGTGVNTHPEFAPQVIAAMAAHTGLPLQQAPNHFEAQAAQDASVETSGALKTLAVSLIKIANDIRWLGSGPRCGIGELRLPSLQPGSSIMPGKVNPVIPEAVIQVAYQVLGNDTAITLGGQSGVFELNVSLPLIANNLLQSITLLTGAVGAFVEKCIQGLEADEKRCAAYIERSLALATPLVPHIGYDRAAQIAKKAYATGKTVRQVAHEERLMPPDFLDKLLNGP